MVVTASPQTYHHLIEYGMRKTSLRFDRLLLQAFMAGVYIGIAGNGSIGLAGGQYLEKADPRAIPSATQKFLYASVFPTAFIAIIFTGAELFTGNTMTMLICLFERRITFLHVIINWVGSFLGNWLGTLFSAYFLTYLCSNYGDEPYFSYLNHSAEVKVNYGFFSCFLRGVGCNTLVCLAVWNVTATDDAAGKILALWFPIVTFVLAGYEHIIANLYTLQLALMLGVNVSVGQVLLYNILPTLLGNLVGGCVIIGAVYWYNFYPLEDYGNNNDDDRSSLLGTSNNIKGSFYNQPISRVISRSSVSPSIMGIGTKPIETFGGTTAGMWRGYDIKPSPQTGPQLRPVQNGPSVSNLDAVFPREVSPMGGGCEVVSHIETDKSAKQL